MDYDELGSAAAVDAESAALGDGRKPWVVEPFLHIGDGILYNPLSCREINTESELLEPLLAMIRGELGPADLDRELRLALEEQAWIVEDDGRLSHRYRLRGVSLETHSVCNHRCYFCPVSVAPRPAHFMPTELFESIVEQLGPYHDTIEGVFLNNYNEPTVDKRFVDQCRTVMRAELPLAIVTNATGLTFQRIDAIHEIGRLRFLCINLSTIDRERYRRDRGKDHLEIVLRHIEYAGNHPLADEMAIVVLGTGDDQHQENFEQITRHFEDSHFDVRYEAVLNRAGNIDVGLAPSDPGRRLAGCENVGSRPVQHIHITATGSCVLCCQDYSEDYVVGDLNTDSIHEVMSGEALARYRRLAYGLEEALADFICRHCVSALTR